MKNIVKSTFWVPSQFYYIDIFNNFYSLKPSHTEYFLLNCCHTRFCLPLFWRRQMSSDRLSAEPPVSQGSKSSGCKKERNAFSVKFANNVEDGCEAELSRWDVNLLHYLNSDCWPWKYFWLFVFFLVQSTRSMWLSLPLSAQLLLDVAVKEAEEAEGCGGLHLPVELLHDDLLHPHHVRHCEAILTDADQVTGQRHILLLFWGLHSNVEAAQAHTGQVLWLNLKDRER